MVIATLNAGRYLDSCLESIREQDYPPDLIEIILADAGSSDGTLAIAAKHRVDRVLPNPRVTGEAGKAVAIAAATGDLILSVDADNYLIGRDWLTKMVNPMIEDASIFASEPVRWYVNPRDPPINRYFALTGVADPVSLFVGNYSHHCYLTGAWTECNVGLEQRNGYVVATLDPNDVPTLGANGFLVRKELLLSRLDKDYHFDIDAVAEIVRGGHRRLAKVDAEIGHHFVRNLRNYARKTRRRAQDYLYWREQRTYTWTAKRGRLMRFVVYSVLVVPLLTQSIRGYRRMRDRAWFYHLPICWLTLAIYALTWATGWIIRRPHSREGWAH